MDDAFMPLKMRVSYKINDLLVELNRHLKKNLNTEAGTWPKELLLNSGKLTRGENYQSYAYRVLDYPSFFKGEDIFTLRTLMLWGHHFSFHLILAGKFKKNYQNRIIKKQKILETAGFRLCIEESPWQWKMREGDYLPENSPEFGQNILRMDFVKLSRKWPLEDYGKLLNEGLRLEKVVEAVIKD